MVGRSVRALVGWIGLEACKKLSRPFGGSLYYPVSGQLDGALFSIIGHVSGNFLILTLSN